MRSAPDIHMGNILFRLPEKGSAFPFPSAQKSQIGSVTKTDGSSLEIGVPQYLVEPVEYDIENFDCTNGVMLVDLRSGAYLVSNYNSCRVTDDRIYHSIPLLEPTGNDIYTHVAAPPELVFKHPLTQAVDIWNLGCTVRRTVGVATIC